MFYSLLLEIVCWLWSFEILQEPIILKNCHLADVTKKWSLKYMKENILSNDLSMFLSNSRIFLFYREKLHTGKYPWRRPHILRFGNFSTFLNLKKEIEKANNGSRIYLIVSDTLSWVFVFSYMLLSSKCYLYWAND